MCREDPMEDGKAMTSATHNSRETLLKKNKPEAL